MAQCSSSSFIDLTQCSEAPIHQFQHELVHKPIFDLKSTQVCLSCNISCNIWASAQLLHEIIDQLLGGGTLNIFGQGALRLQEMVCTGSTVPALTWCCLTKTQIHPAIKGEGHICIYGTLQIGHEGHQLLQCWQFPGKTFHGWIQQRRLCRHSESPPWGGTVCPKPRKRLVMLVEASLRSSCDGQD